MLYIQYTQSFLLLKWYYKGQVLAGKKTSEGQEIPVDLLLAERESDEEHRGEEEVTVIHVTLDY